MYAFLLSVKPPILFSFELGLALFEERRNAFLLILGRKSDREKIDLAAEAFIEVRARRDFDGLFA